MKDTRVVYSKIYEGVYNVLRSYILLNNLPSLLVYRRPPHNVWRLVEAGGRILLSLPQSYRRIYGDECVVALQ